VERLLTIAIDGPAAGGKGTVGPRLAERLGYTFVDTGAMYRAVAWLALEKGADPNDEAAVTRLAESATIRFLHIRSSDGLSSRVLVDDVDVTEEIRQPEIDRAASLVARFPGVRRVLVRLQQEMAAGGGVVMEGRDITTVVLPHADVKLFVTASLEERARRRYQQRLQRGEEAELVTIESELAERDRRDSERKEGPLRVPPDAVIVDTTGLSVDEVVESVWRLITARFPDVKAHEPS